MHRTSVSLAALTVCAALLAGCASDSASPSAEPATGDGHGHVEGAQEVAEPQLHLVTQDPDGAVDMYDLLADEWAALGDVEPATASATDGRYMFSIADDGVTIIDSGMWTWDHGDHFHFYRSEPRMLGTVDGDGVATVATTLMSTTGGTGLFFPTSGEAVLLDTQALSKGEIVELFRLELAPHAGIVAPIGDGAFVTRGDGTLQYVSSEGESVPELTATCTAPGGHITSRVGLVIGCDEGAFLATLSGGEVATEMIPYPEGVSAERAWDFDNREGRPTVAALAGDTGFWLLDTRNRAWTLVTVDTPLLSVVAVDDTQGHVVALDAEGRVRVYAAETGEQLSVTEPLLPNTLGTPLMDGVHLTVDADRAYLNAPAEAVIYEIDYADGARIARTIETPSTPVYFAEVGR